MKQNLRNVPIISIIILLTVLFTPAVSIGNTAVSAQETTTVSIPSPSITPGDSAGEPKICINPSNMLILNVDKVVRTAEENNPDIKMARARVEYARGQYLEAKSSQNVKFNITGSYANTYPVPEFELGGRKMKLGVEDNWSAKAVLSKIISTFGDLENTVSASALNVAASEENYLTMRENIIFRVKDSYFKYLKSIGGTQIAWENLEIVKAQLKKANDMFEEGVVPRFEVVRGKLYLTQGEQAYITAKKAQEVSLVELLNIMAVDLNSTVLIKDDSDDRNMIRVNQELAEETALQNRHELRSLKISLESANRILESARCGQNPVLTLNSIFENKTAAGLSAVPNTVTTSLMFTIPVGDGGLSYSRVKKAEASIAEIKENIDKTTRQIRLEIKQDLLTLREIEARLESAGMEVETATENYSIALARFDNGISTGLELDDSRKSLNSSKVNYLNLKYEYQIALARLEQSMATSLKGVMIQ